MSKAEDLDPRISGASEDAHTTAREAADPGHPSASVRSPVGHHRYEWLYLTAFVQPQRGEVAWYPSNGISKPFFEAVLESFARTVGAGRQRVVVLVLDNAGWHSKPKLKIPAGLHLVHLPPYSPELQPAERLWPLVDEPVANRYFETLGDLDDVLARRCLTLSGIPDLIRGHTRFHWWPNPAVPLQ